MGAWLIQERAILGDNPFAQIQLRKDRDQILQLPSGDQNDLAAGCSEALQRPQYGLGYTPVGSQGAVVITCEREIAHESPAAPQEQSPRPARVGN